MKKIFALALALALCLSLAACGGSKKEEPKQEETKVETVTLKVAASPTPHAEILALVVDDLAAQNIELIVTEYGDYVIPNTAVEEGDEDVNFFQHVPYLDNFNVEHGTHLVSVAAIHVEPMGVYAGKSADLANLPDGASVAVPNDVTNEARALLLLEANGLIKLAEDAGLEATPIDIVENPKNLTFNELEAAMVPTILSEVDLAIINSNFALQAGLNPMEDSLVMEGGESPYANILVVKEGNESNAAVQALIAALQSDEVRDFIIETYEGAVVPAF